MNFVKSTSLILGILLSISASAASPSYTDIPVQSEWSAEFKTNYIFQQIVTPGIKQLNLIIGTAQEKGQYEYTDFWTKNYYRKQFDSSLQSYVETIGASRLMAIHAQISKLEADNKKSADTIINYRDKMRSAKSAQNMNTFERNTSGRFLSKEAYAESIRQEAATIEDRQAAIKELESQFFQALQQIGVKVTEVQAKTLLYTATGFDDIAMFGVHSSVKEISEILKNCIASQEGCPQEQAIPAGGTAAELVRADTQKTYFAAYTILVRLTIAAKKKFIANIDIKYKPKLETIIGATNALIDETKLRLTEAERADKDGPLAKTYRQNLASQTLTADTAAAYKRYLETARTKLETAIPALEQTYLVAENTYGTVEVASVLLDTIRSSMSNLEQAMALSVPEMLQFNNLEVETKLRELTVKMRQ